MGRDGLVLPCRQSLRRNRTLRSIKPAAAYPAVTNTKLDWNEWLLPDKYPNSAGPAKEPSIAMELMNPMAEAAADSPSTADGMDHNADKWAFWKDMMSTTSARVTPTPGT